MGWKELLGIEKKTSTVTKETEVNKLSTNQQAIANFLADRNSKDSQDKIRRVLIELVEQTKALTQQDIAKWRQAWQRAISVEWPSRIDLYAIYRDVEMDNHLTGVIGQIKNEVLQKVFDVIDKDSSDSLPEQKKQLEDAQWFIDFCGYIVDHVFNGYELVQFGDVVEINGVRKFDCVETVTREHVIPEYHVFVKNMNDSYKNGIDYTLPPYSNWCIGIGKPKDLGLFNKVARHAISKKNIEGFWDKFAQIFGMPIRIGKTNSSNPKDRNEIAEMLQKMGAAAWGMFPDGTDIEIKETTRGDAWMVYDKRIERANSEMSKAIVNQTMTTDNGSSKSQGEVHLEIQNNVIEYFARLIRIVVNDKLVPFMQLHGFQGWENARFVFDDTVEYTVDEQVKIEEMIMKHFEIDPEYLIKKYGIPVKGVKVAPKNSSNFFD
ncbi:MAG: DUF935 family protein [Sediminibacterium sp.]|nr:DUF935 family protein [Sediminibacterium sp.]MDP3128809.1 DUF935 family protein [Sediminibacterium sp.]